MGTAGAAAAAPARLWQIDALRGLMLVLMMLTHLPTRLAAPAGQPFGFVSSAEGFVLLSAFMSGWLYTRRLRRGGEAQMRAAFLRRVLVIYLSQAALLCFLFTVVVAIGTLSRHHEVTDLASFFLAHPLDAVAGSLLLVYNPPLLDILPMYVLFMLASSLALGIAHRRGWAGLFAASAAVWVAAQLGLGGWVYEAVVRVAGFAIPRREVGAFNVFAWQFLWTLGLWLGACYADGRRMAFPPAAVALAGCVALVGFVWRHAVGQAPFGADAALDALFDKWHLGPLRLLNLFALVVLAIRFAPWLSTHLPRLRVLEWLGAASLPVFCVHLVVVLLALAIVGQPRPGRPWSEDLALLVIAYAAMVAAALASRRLDRRDARRRAAAATQGTA